MPTRMAPLGSSVERRLRQDLTDRIGSGAGVDGDDQGSLAAVRPPHEDRWPHFPAAEPYIANADVRFPVRNASKTALLVAAAAVVACGCKPLYSTDTNYGLEATISADGLTVAVLDSPGTDQQRLRTRRIDKDIVWQEIPAPRFTQTIRFGFSGNELLLTHKVPPDGELTQLTRWDLNDLTHDSVSLMQAPDLAFPIEVASGVVMVRTRKAAQASNSIGGYQWLLLGPHDNSQVIGPKTMLPFSQPSIVGSGFFWFDQGLWNPTDGSWSGRVISHALPGGEAPSIDVASLGKDTTGLVCNSTASRCLRTMLENGQDRNKTFVYSLEVLTGKSRCRVPTIAGYLDTVSMTPSGTAAVVAFAIKADQPRTVVVLRFDAPHCLPTKVIELPFSGG